ncbi:mismatch-specific DNA-glycosylase [Caulobacter sp. LjRoot300]|uniref:mismatch-specific DNA-glycosylase n=1 Tax=Caulobacter sp. LjRoot300 TaxID=3342321 RepID=UPI003ECF6ABD
MEKPLPDIVAPGLDVVFCGLNPGLSAASAGHHFVGRGNRFWRVLHLAGFTPDQIDPKQAARLLAHGLGITSVVERPTAGVDDLARSEFVAAAARFEPWVRRWAPRCVAFLGKGGLRGDDRAPGRALGPAGAAPSAAPSRGCCPIPAAAILPSARTPW